MPVQQLYIGNISKGQVTNRTAFNIDNDSFPALINAYQWRGRVKRKRGTSLLGRLTRYISTNSPSTTSVTSFVLSAGSANLFTAFSIPTPASLVVGAVGVQDITTGLTYHDSSGIFRFYTVITGATQTNPCVLTIAHAGPYTIGDQVIISGVAGMTQLNGNIYTVQSFTPTTLTITVNATGFSAYSASSGTVTDLTYNGGTVDYSTGIITITAGASDTMGAGFFYYPDLPVLGLENAYLQNTQVPQLLGFDTTYSYNINTTSFNIQNVSWYKNPAAAPAYPGYTPKTTPTPVNWNAQTYQQFWTTNYQNAMWATTGVQVPFASNNIGMQFKPIQSVTVISAGPPAIVTLNITAHGLVVGDFLFINEVANTTVGINFQTGYVIASPAPGANTVTVEFPNATIVGNTASPSGIAQYLTNSSDTTKDCLRWYDGNPVDSVTVPLPTLPFGWVNFSPPLSFGSFGIEDEPAAQYYLVGAKAILPFKDRLLFFGAVVQTSSVTNPAIYLEDTVVYSQNGTPYYTCSFLETATSLPTSAKIQYTPILVPAGQTATASAYFDDATGFGGNQSVGVSQPIITVTPNEDVLLLGMARSQIKLVYTGNDIIPFNFYTTNSELGSMSTFSAITLDKAGLTIGGRGIVISSQTGSERIDLDIPDKVFEFSLLANGAERICAQRDFINEWVYFTYCSNSQGNPSTNLGIYPNQSLQYNYRDQSWGVFNESYTTYGELRPASGMTWATLNQWDINTWNDWDVPWNFSQSTALQPQVIGGNQQGFIMIRGGGTSEASSLYIKSISGNLVTSPQHGLNAGDYILIAGALGTVGAAVNGKIFSANVQDADTFFLNPSIGAGLTYSGNGTITRYYLPEIVTKQFPTFWEGQRKTRIGMQQYLFTSTSSNQVTVNMYLSQNSDSPWNNPNTAGTPNSLEYSQIVYTCQEPNNLQMQVTGQSQIWHRMNTSLIGDSVQLEITMSDAQMRDQTTNNATAEIELHAISMNLYPSSLLA